MSAGETVLKALGFVTQSDDLKYQTLVSCSLAKDPKARFYFCLGQVQAIIVDQDYVRDGDAEQVCAFVKYNRIEQISYSEDDDELFAVYTSEVNMFADTSKEKKESDQPFQLSSQRLPSVLFFRSHERLKLLKELELCYRIAYEIATWQVPPHSIVVPSKMHKKNKSLHWGYPSKEVPTHIAIEGFRMETIGDFSLVVPGHYYLVLDTLGEQTCMFEKVYADSKTNGTSKELRFVQVRVHKKNVIDDEQSPPVPLLYEIQQLVNDIGSQVSAYSTLLEPTAYVPVVSAARNGQWEFYETRIRTGKGINSSAMSQRHSQQDIHVVIARVSMVPPSYNTTQDIEICFFGCHRDQLVPKLVHHMVDSLCTTGPCNEDDRLVNETMADALMLTDKQFEWFENELDVRPQCYALARSFCFAILALTGLDKDHLGNSLNNGGTTDPFEIAQNLERTPPVKNLAPASLMLWRRRVWRYLAWCADGHMLPGQLDLPTITRACESDHLHRSQLSQLIDTFLYLREEGKEFQQKRLVEKLMNDRLMSRPRYNEAVMAQLIQTGYIAREIQSNVSQGGVYLRCLLQILRHSCTRGVSPQDQTLRATHSLHHAIGLEIVQVTSTYATEAPDPVKQSHNEFETLIPHLILFLKSSDENLQYYATLSLLNLCRESYMVRAQVMGSASRTLVSLVGSGRTHVRFVCSLLNTCTKTNTQFRILLARHGLIPQLLNLIPRRSVEPYRPPLPVIVQACAVLGNLALEPSLKADISNGLGTARVHILNQELDVPRTHVELVGLLRDKVLLAFESGEDEAAEVRWKESLQASVVYALKNLAGRSEVNRTSIGRLGTGTLLDILRGCELHQTVLVNLCLTCIGVLTFSDENCERLDQLDALQILSEYRNHPQFGNVASRISRKLNAHMKHRNSTGS